LAVNSVGYKRAAADYALIIIGLFFVAASIDLLYSPSQMVTGGVTGLAIIIQRVSANFGFAVPIWLTNTVFNLPLFIIGFRALGARMLWRSLFATAGLSVALFLLDFIRPLEADLFLTSIFGGVLGGVGSGLVFRSFATTGGSDLAASIMQKYMRQYPLSRILFVINSCVIALGMFVFGYERAMYAILSVFVSTKMIDGVMEGFSYSKAAFIISEKSEEIAAKINRELRRGVTGLSGRGMYTGDQKNVLMCVVPAKEIVRVVDFVRAIDNKAFVMMTDVREVLGQGFKTLS